MRYLQNAWVVACWSSELRSGSMVARILLDTPVVVFRSASGVPSAVLDRCPHRFAPLSKGVIDGDSVVCAYHGLAFDGAGRCTRNPHGPILKSMATQAFPLREAYRAIWIWMGEPALADDTPLPDLAFMDAAPDTAYSEGYVRGNGHYQLFVDNILDLTHADFLHPDTLGGGTFTQTKAKVMEREDRIAVHWHSFDTPPSPLSVTLSGKTDRVDGWTEVEWFAPATMTLKSGSVPAGTPRSAGGNVMNVHIMTPETADTTHYFFASTRDFAIGDQVLNDQIAKIRAHIFATEDKPMIEAQAARIGGADFWSLQPILLNIDAGPVTVRRRLDAMIAAQSNGDRSSQFNHEADKA